MLKRQETNKTNDDVDVQKLVGGFNPSQKY